MGSFGSNLYSYFILQNLISSPREKGYGITSIKVKGRQGTIEDVKFVNKNIFRKKK
jgi:hypothetical protein